MGNQNTKLQENISNTIRTSPESISISFEILILLSVIFTLIALVKFLKNFVKKEIRKMNIRNNIQ